MSGGGKDSEMTMYAPILKGKPAEYWAFRSASPAALAGTRMLFEVVPRRGPDRDVADFVNGIAAGGPTGTVVTVDTGYLDQSVAITGSPEGALLWTSRALDSRGIAARPVF